MRIEVEENGLWIDLFNDQDLPMPFDAIEEGAVLEITVDGYEDDIYRWRRKGTVELDTGETYTMGHFRPDNVVHDPNGVPVTTTCKYHRQWIVAF